MGLRNSYFNALVIASSACLTTASADKPADSMPGKTVHDIGVNEQSGNNLRGLNRPVPEMAMGTTNADGAFLSKTATPAGANGFNCPDAERVPSGKITADSHRS